MSRTNNPQYRVNVPARQPRKADDLPATVDGIKVELFELPPQTVRAYKRSDLQRMTPEQYDEHQEAIDLAQQNGLIIDDVTPDEVIEARDRASARSAERMMVFIRARDSRLAQDVAYRELSDAWIQLETAKQNGDQYQIASLTQKVADLDKSADDASLAAREAAAAAEEAKKVQ